MTWTVRFLSSVTEDDLPEIDQGPRRAILKAIQTKLSTAPESFGEPLRKELFGFRKLRVGDYRVIYQVKKNIVTVLIVRIGLRRDAEVYREMVARVRGKK